MLVLSRKQEQRIQIGENVTVTILQIKGRSVRIGIEAPREMHIVRDELRSDETDAAAPPAKETTPSPQPPQSDRPAMRRRDRVREARRCPAFGRRRMSDEAGDGPLRRRLDERRRGDQLSVLSPTRCRDEQRHLGSMSADLGGEAIIDRANINLHLDPYQQAVSLRHTGATGFNDTDESPVVRALRWRV